MLEGESVLSRYCSCESGDVRCRKFRLDQECSFPPEFMSRMRISLDLTRPDDTDMGLSSLGRLERFIDKLTRKEGERHRDIASKSKHPSLEVKVDHRESEKGGSLRVR